MTATLTTSVLTWLRGAYPNGVPDEDASALHSVLHERLGNAKAHDVLRNLLADGLLSPAAGSALLPDDEAMSSAAGRWLVKSTTKRIRHPRRAPPLGGLWPGSGRATPGGSRITTTFRSSHYWNAG